MTEENNINKIILNAKLHATILLNYENNYNLNKIKTEKLNKNKIINEKNSTKNFMLLNLKKLLNNLINEKNKNKLNEQLNVKTIILEKNKIIENSIKKMKK